MDSPNTGTSSASRLDSWKEIAAYLKRDVRTVQRWEKDEGLPVHRLLHGKQGSVYAHPAELDAWWDSRRRELEKTAPVRPRFPGRARAAILAVPLLLTAAWAIARLTSKATDIGAVNRAASGIFEFPVVVPDNGGFGLDVSPDGRRLAFDVCCAPPRIFVHDFASGVTRLVAGSEGGVDPVFSPDGSRLLFRTDRALKTIDLNGGPAVTLWDKGAWTAGLSFGASWGAHDAILFAAGAGLLRIPASGGPVEQIVVDEGLKGAVIRSSPRWLADGRHFIYHVRGSGASAEYVGSTDAPRASRLVDTEYPAVAVPPFVLFLRGTALMAQRLDDDAQRLTGEAIVVAADVAPGSLDTNARFAASRTGVLAFAGWRGGQPAQLTWFDRSQRETGAILPAGTDDYLNPSISPDGRQVAVNRMDPQTGNWDIWTIDLARGIPSRATFDAAVDSDAVWSPDSRQIVFASRRGGQLGLYRKTLGEDREEALALFPDALQLVPSDWSPDERFILFTAWNRSGQNDVQALGLQGDHRPEVLVRGRPLAYGARVSPDGRWIAYSALDTGKMEIYLQPFRASGETRQISSGGGVHPRWTADGREIVYWAEPKGLMGVTLTPTAVGLSAAAPRHVLDVPIVLLIDSRTPWDMTRDGRRFLVRRPTGTAQPSITVVVNWIERLRRSASGSDEALQPRPR